MKIYAYCVRAILILSVLSSLSACTREQQDKSAFPVSVDLIQALRTAVHQETVLIDFTNDAHRDHYLLRGWANKPDSDHVWANRDRSSVLFYTNDTTDIDAAIICQAIASKEI